VPDVVEGRLPSVVLGGLHSVLGAAWAGL